MQHFKIKNPLGGSWEKHTYMVYLHGAYMVELTGVFLKRLVFLSGL